MTNRIHLHTLFLLYILVGSKIALNIDMMKKNYILLCCSMLIFVHSINANSVFTQKELTVLIAPGASDCFYTHALQNHIIDMEYQVIDGGHGDLDISFEIQTPQGYSIVNEYKKSDNIHRITAQSEGDYRFCFDNSFSMFNTKTVFFEVIVEWADDEKHADENEWDQNILEKVTADQLVDMKVKQIICASSEKYLNLFTLSLSFFFFLFDRFKISKRF